MRDATTVKAHDAMTSLTAVVKVKSKQVKVNKRFISPRKAKDIDVFSVCRRTEPTG